MCVERDWAAGGQKERNGSRSMTLRGSLFSLCVCMCVVIFSFALLFSVRRTSCFDYVAGQESCSAAAAEATAAAAAASAVQREERSRVLRERQNEERQRKLEELKQQVRLVCLSHTFNSLLRVICGLPRRPCPECSA